MADERLNDLENARTMNNAGVVDTGDSERAQQENLVTQTAQAHYEETRASGLLNKVFIRLFWANIKCWKANMITAGPVKIVTFF